MTWKLTLFGESPCYKFYPPPHECFEDLNMLSMDRLYGICYWRSLTQKCCKCPFLITGFQISFQYVLYWKFAISLNKNFQKMSKIILFENDQKFFYSFQSNFLKSLDVKNFYYEKWKKILLIKNNEKFLVKKKKKNKVSMIMEIKWKFLNY